MTWVWKRFLTSGYTYPEISDGTERIGARCGIAGNISRGAFASFTASEVDVFVEPKSSRDLEEMIAVNGMLSRQTGFYVKWLYRPTLVWYRLFVWGFASRILGAQLIQPNEKFPPVVRIIALSALANPLDEETGYSIRQMESAL